MEQEWRLYIKEYADSVMRSEFGAFISVGDIIDAIIYLEQMKKSSKLKIKAKAEEVLGKDTEQIKDQLKEMLKLSN